MQTQFIPRALRRFALGCALVPIAWLGGCGGGSNGPLAPRPNPTATPVATTEFRAIGDLQFSDLQNFPSGFPTSYAPVTPTGTGAFNVFAFDNQPSLGAFEASPVNQTPATLVYVQGLRRDAANPGQDVNIRVQLSPTVFLPAKRGDRPLAVGDTFNLADNNREPAYLTSVSFNGLAGTSGTVRIRSISATSISFELNNVTLVGTTDLSNPNSTTIKVNGVLTGTNLSRPQPL